MRLIVGFLALFTSLFARPIEELAYDGKGPNKVGYLHLSKDRPIDSSTVLYVKFALDHFRKEGAKFIVLDLDTPGGEVFSAIKICEMLKKIDAEDKIPVIAYVDNWAISAGAMLAYSCRYIGITSSASMGAAEPVIVDSQGGVSTASEKMNSALRSEFTNLAAYWGRSGDLAEAMVDKDVILVWRNGIVRLDDESQIKLGKDIVITKKGKLLTLNAAQLQQYGVADFAADDLFTQPLLAAIPNREMVSYENWKVDFFSWLSNPVVMSLLTLGLIAGFYFELQNPGLTFPLVIGLVCLSLIVLSHFSMQAIDWLEAGLLVSGIALLALEFFVLPGFGIAGVLGIVLTLAGLAALEMPHFDTVRFFPEWNLAAMALMDSLVWFCASILAAALLIFFMTRRLSRRFVLTAQLENEEIFLPPPGSLGKAFTPLRPSGKVEIGGKIYDAASEGLAISAGADVAVVRHEGNKVYVRSP